MDGRLSTTDSVSEHAIGERGLAAKIIAVRSRFFGGNIRAGGLLTVSDFSAAYDTVIAEGYSPVEVTLPRIAFDHWGRDLEGVHYREFTQKCGLSIILAG